jgi:tRNA G18 (ribose-2'-O)-methylase SpoU
MRRPAQRNAEDICAGTHRIAVLEGITDVTNVGAIFRSAAALGAEAVLLSPDCCDPLSRRGIRVSMGTVFQIPWARLGDSAADWPRRGMERLRAMGFCTAALALREDAVTLDDPRLAREERLALLLGAEGDGLARSTVARCDYTVRIPMSAGVDSLNVAAAGAVAFWQLRYRKE